MFLEAVEITRNVLHDYIFKCESRSKAIYFTREGKNSELMPISDCIYCFFRLTCPDRRIYSDCSSYFPSWPVWTSSAQTASTDFPLSLSKSKTLFLKKYFFSDLESLYSQIQD